MAVDVGIAVGVAVGMGTAVGVGVGVGDRVGVASGWAQATTINAPRTKMKGQRDIVRMARLS